MDKLLTDKSGSTRIILDDFIILHFNISTVKKEGFTNDFVFQTGKITGLCGRLS